MSALQRAFDTIRQNAANKVESGTTFEQLAKVFFENDATQKQQYSKVWHYKDWTKERPEYQNKDMGIDLVAKLRDEDGYCAIQCKFYQPGQVIAKTDLDSFISASSTSDFTRLVLIDTSTQSIGVNAQSVLDNLDKGYNRIQLSELEESRIDWTSYINDGSVRLHSKKTLRDDQRFALEEIKKGLAEGDRGKMIMACGTGKTFTSLRIAEDITGAGKLVLYMVPSLALMSQTVREWKNDAAEDLTAFSACSDDRVGKRRAADDQIEVNLNDLAFPATTDARKLAEQIKGANKSRMTVVFSTYHSIDVISQSQHEYGLDKFDLIICDEAHRTTGATLVGEDESNFIKIHSDDNIKGKKRLYMTATPRIYGEKARKKEDEGEVALASMDDEDIFGKTLIHRSFGWAVENNLLTDYKVAVLMMDEQIVSDNVQKAFVDGGEMKLDDATKMVGCYKALAKIGISSRSDDESPDKEPMKRALAFCQNIHFSKIFSDKFSNVVNEYIKNEKISKEHKTDLEVQLEHVDGTFNAEQRNEKLSWLKEDTDENVCRVLSNVRCLSEGVDVPALDAIMFVHPRKSQIDVVQSVGRVMRKAEGKKLGYVIIPVAVAPGVSPEQALNNNERYKVIWQILNALRAHDERFDSTINKIGLGEDVSDRIEIIDATSKSELEATTAVVDDVGSKTKKNADDSNEGDTILGGEDETETKNNEDPVQLPLIMTGLSQAIKAKIVDKCGTRDYWEKWASDIADIAQKHIVRINSIVLNSNTPERKTFMEFVAEIRDDLNPEISETDAVEMLAQHIITRPVFDALFQGNHFTSENAVSKAMETVLSQIYAHNIEAESETLEKFYASVKRRAADVMTSNGRQTLVLELYDRFFRNAFPLMTKKLGIVYTPVEVVDFIIHSVEDVMKEEFDSSLGDDGVHILDPFTGTGTFISRLLQSDIMSKEQIRGKFKSEIHANEIILLAYYIACINIEAVYQDLVKENQYQSFDGIVLTDTFQLYEQDKDMVANLLPDNSEKRTKQKKRDITVIIGNPPYSAGQSSANDNAANITYPNLDNRISQTYVKNSKATLKTSLYDSYIRAFKWASERIGDEGVIGFVTNGGWVDGNATDGFRESLVDEFSKIYLFHLRGNARTSGELRRKEKGNVFGEGTRTPIVITILVKNKNSVDHGKIFFHDIGDYLDQKQKLRIISNFKSISGIEKVDRFIIVEPDEDNDWVNQGDKRFGRFIPLGNKNNVSEKSLFEVYSSGVKTNRDAWAYNFSRQKLSQNMEKLIVNYNAEIDLLSGDPQHVPSNNSEYINWDGTLVSDYKKLKKGEFSDSKIVTSLYRPFTKSNLYLCKQFNNSVYRIPEIFSGGKERVPTIIVSGIGASKGFSCLMTDQIYELQLINNGQGFPLKTVSHGNKIELISRETVNENIKNLELVAPDFKNWSKFPTNDDFFHMIYSVLHSKNYREAFQNNLSKSLPRIPRINGEKIFFQFVNFGENLAKLHMNFDTAEKFLIDIKEGDLRLAHIDDTEKFFRVEKMKFASKDNKSTVIYNKNITIQNIPLEAYEYVVNGKSALEWVMERQAVTKDKASGIVNDANDYANETMNNPKYPLELFQRVITVSLETMKIVKSLPKLDID